MNSIYDEFEVTIDGKGRFQFPMPLRNELPKGQSDVFYMKYNKKCITIYTLDEWALLDKKLSKLNEMNSISSEYKSIFLTGAQKVALDSAGKMNIKGHILERLGISKECILRVLGNKAELWDKDSYFRYQDENLDKENELSEKINGSSSFFVD